MNENYIIKKIMLKEGTSKQVLEALSNYMESKGKFIANGQDEGGNLYIVCRFENKMDYLAFAVYLGEQGIWGKNGKSNP